MSMTLPWFRRYLRFDDHPALRTAPQRQATIMPLFILGGDDPLAGISRGQGLKGAQAMPFVVPGGERGCHAVGEDRHAEVFGGDGGRDAGAGDEADGLGGSLRAVRWDGMIVVAAWRF